MDFLTAGLRNNVRFGLQLFNAPCKIWHEITVIFFPKFRGRPIGAFNSSAAIGAFAITVEFIDVRAVTHGIVEIQFLSSFDVAHGNDTDLACETDIRITGMVEAIGRFQWQTGF